MRVQIRVVVPNTGKMLKVIPRAITNDNLTGLNPCLNNLESEWIIFIFMLHVFDVPIRSMHIKLRINKDDYCFVRYPL